MVSEVIAAIGNFDGVHSGHRLLLDRTISFASDVGAHAGIVVFDPHPRRYFQPDTAPFLITSNTMRERLLRRAGAQQVYTLGFDKALASLSPEAFVSDILKGRLGLAGVSVGSEFRFGAGRAGDAGAMEALCKAAGMHAVIIDPLVESGSGDKVGSSAVRKAIEAGEMKCAATMLGRNWSVEGLVCEGARLGRKIGFPTANFSLGEIIEPRCGVYAVRAKVKGETIQGVANFGRRPTVGAQAPLLETHLFDFSRDIYGEKIEVEFVDFIRDEKKFDGLEALKAQIAKDCEIARNILGPE